MARISHEQLRQIVHNACLSGKKVYAALSSTEDLLDDLSDHAESIMRSGSANAEAMDQYHHYREGYVVKTKDAILKVIGMPMFGGTYTISDSEKYLSNNVENIAELLLNLPRCISEHQLDKDTTAGYQTDDKETRSMLALVHYITNRTKRTVLGSAWKSYTVQSKSSKEGLKMQALEAAGLEDIKAYAPSGGSPLFYVLNYINKIEVCRKSTFDAYMKGDKNAEQADIVVINEEDYDDFLLALPLFVKNNKQQLGFLPFMSNPIENDGDAVDEQKQQEQIDKAAKIIYFAYRDICMMVFSGQLKHWYTKTGAEIFAAQMPEYIKDAKRLTLDVGQFVWGFSRLAASIVLDVLVFKGAGTAVKLAGTTGKIAKVAGFKQAIKAVFSKMFTKLPKLGIITSFANFLDGIDAIKTTITAFHFEKVPGSLQDVLDLNIGQPTFDGNILADLIGPASELFDSLVSRFPKRVFKQDTVDEVEERLAENWVWTL